MTGDERALIMFLKDEGKRVFASDKLKPIFYIEEDGTPTWLVCIPDKGHLGKNMKKVLQRLFDLGFNIITYQRTDLDLVMTDWRMEQIKKLKEKGLIKCYQNKKMRSFIN